MINKKNIFSIEKLINNEIIYSQLLSDSFGICCIEFKTYNKKKYIAKFYKNNQNGFNAIKSEVNNLMFFNKLEIKYFPKVIVKDDNYLIMSFIENNGIIPEITKDDLLQSILNIHSFKSEKYGFDFDTQIGGLRQINKSNNNWVDFYRELRLGYVFELINKTEPMERAINDKIEKILKNLENFIPKKPEVSLLHGDLWEGNILFNNTNFAGFIDPGSFYGHNELEIAYLTWFNPIYIKNNFLDKYNEVIKIHKDYKSYEPVYQLYYSLINVYLWDRNYIQDVKKLIDKIKI